MKLFSVYNVTVSDYKSSKYLCFHLNPREHYRIRSYNSTLHKKNKKNTVIKENKKQYLQLANSTELFA